MPFARNAASLALRCSINEFVSSMPVDVGGVNHKIPFSARKSEVVFIPDEWQGGALATKQLNLAFGCSRIRAVIRFGDMENRFKDTCRLLFFLSVRWLERRLSVRSLYRILRPYGFVRAAFKGIPASVHLPACLGAGKVSARHQAMSG